jgi:hypothetical protein
METGLNIMIKMKLNGSFHQGIVGLSFLKKSEKRSRQMIRHGIFMENFIADYIPDGNQKLVKKIIFFSYSISKGEISWRFTRDDNYAGSADPFKFVEGPIRRKNYEIFQGMKLFTNDKTQWVSEAIFLKDTRNEAQIRE